MGLNPGTFLKRTQGIVTGDGYKRQIDGVRLDHLRNDDGTVIAGAGNLGHSALETSYTGICVRAGQTNMGTLGFHLPEDYDETQDKLRVKFLVVGEGSADEPKISFDTHYKRAGYALSTLGEVSTTAINKSAGLASWRTAKIDGSSLKAGDAIQLEISTGGHTTDAVFLYDVAVEYASDLVFYDKDDRDFS